MAKTLSLLNILLCFLVLFSCGSFVLSRTSPHQDSEMMKMFEEWMVKHNRVHNNLDEKNRRFEIFKDNVARVEAHNKVEGRKYDLAVNKFADLTMEEIKAKHTGFRRQPRPAAQTATTTGPDQESDDDDVPESIDWREKGAVGSVKDQKKCGSCWAFAVVAGMEGITQIKTGELLDLSEQELVDCDTLDMGCRGGGFDTAFTWIVNNSGLNSEEAYPYIGKDGDCKKKECSIAVANITGFEHVPVNDEKALKRAVAKQPVVIAIDASFNFDFYASGIFEDDFCGTELNHAITIVGYDALEDGTPYWIAKNSWGKDDWGEEGYIRIRRDVEAEEGMCGLAMTATYPTK